MPPTAEEPRDQGCLIRVYTPEDWEQVCRVHDAARVQELAAAAVDLRAFRTMADAAEEDEFFDSETLVACEGDTVVGFVSWNVDYVTWMYVAPHYQRRGIGRRLFAEALRRIGDQAWTTVLVGNEPALSLYRAAGMEIAWTRSGDCEGYPCSGMRLALPTSRMRDPEARREPRPKEHASTNVEG